MLFASRLAATVAVATVVAGLPGILSGSTAFAATATIHVTQTTADLSDKMTSKPDIALETSTDGNLSTDTSQQFQEVDGFGAAFTDTSTYVLSQLPSTERDDVMKTIVLYRGWRRWILFHEGSHGRLRLHRDAGR